MCRVREAAEEKAECARVAAAAEVRARLARPRDGAR